MKRDNRGVLIVAVLIATMLLTFAFAACETECEHENRQHFEAVEATCVKDGNIEYWYCPDCGVYLDSQNSIRAREELVVKATGEHEFVDGVCLVCGAESEEGLSFKLNDDEASYTVKGIGSATSNNLVIPVTHNGLPVTRIGDNAFSGCSGLTSVTIPDSVTGIGSGAFYGCSGLTTIVIPDSVVSIGSSAFRNCSGLTSVKIPFVGEKADGSGSTDFDYMFGGTALDSLKEVVVTGGESIGEYAFHNCHSLTSVTIEDDVTSIGNGAFYGCNSLTRIAIPFVGANLEGNGETNFGYVFGAQNYLDNADYVPASLKEVIVTGGTSIGEHAFFDFSSLTSVTIPDSVTSIGNDAFYGCSDLTSITIPDSVTSIGSYAFYGCSDLTGITLPDSVTSFGDWAFSLCYGLKSFTIPNRVINIGSYAFSGCSGLTSITIPDSVTNIGDHAFNHCTNLTSITIPFVGTNTDGMGATYFGYIFGASNYSSNDSYVPSSLKEVIITGGESIDSMAFYGCSGLTSVTIPDSVIGIGGGAFYGCSGLTSVMIPDSVTSIGEYAFYGCSGLTSITIPDSVTSISNGAFYNCGSLESIIVEQGNDVYHSAGKCLIETESKMLIVGCKNSVIPKDGSVTSIGEGAFRGCSGLTSIIIPDSVTSIGYEAFYGCDGLTSITISFVGEKADGTGETHFSYIFGASSYSSNDDYVPESLKEVIITGGASIGYSAFSGCSGLTSVTIPDSVTDIGDYAFSGCSGLTSITIPDSVTDIGDYAFSGCSGLTSVTIPDSVIGIGGGAFSGCSGLTSISIPFVGANADGTGSTRFGHLFGNNDNVPDSLKEVIIAGEESIDSNAFYGCSGLTSITIPDSVTSIGRLAFGYCSELTTINFQGTKEQWQAIEKDTNWNHSTGEYAVICTDGTISETDA